MVSANKRFKPTARSMAVFATSRRGGLPKTLGRVQNTLMRRRVKISMDHVRGYLGPLAFLGVGIALLGGAYHYWRITASLIENAVATTGVVILMREEDRHVQPQHQGEAEATYRPVIRFTARNGRQVHYQSIVSSYPPRYSEGERVRVLYDPERPEWARIDDFADLWLRPIFLAGVGSILTLLGAASLHSRHKYGWERTRWKCQRGSRGTE